MYIVVKHLTVLNLSFADSILYLKRLVVDRGEASKWQVTCKKHNKRKPVKHFIRLPDKESLEIYSGFTVIWLYVFSRKACWTKKESFLNEVVWLLSWTFKGMKIASKSEGTLTFLSILLEMFLIPPWTKLPGETRWHHLRTILKTLSRYFWEFAKSFTIDFWSKKKNEDEKKKFKISKDFYGIIKKTLAILILIYFTLIQ